MTKLLSLFVIAGATLFAAEFPAPSVDVPLAPQSSKETAVFAGGCFWGVEGVFERVKGVSRAESGFSGGHVKSPSYDRVSTGTTGHAESVRVVYDPSKITYGQLLTVFFEVAHDPTELNRQGPDTGTQYRSAIFYMNDDQKRIAEAYIKQLNDAHIYQKPIVTQVAPYTGFYLAEPEHQRFLDRNMDYPYIVYNDLPKIEALKKQLPQLCRR
jgi:peptide-methionine (S)-S-oxide reductase